LWTVWGAVRLPKMRRALRGRKNVHWKKKLVLLLGGGVLEERRKDQVPSVEKKKKALGGETRGTAISRDQ